MDALQLTLVGDAFARRDEHFELEWLVTISADFDAVATGFEAELLEQAVEAVDHADEVAVDIDLGVTRFELQPERAGFTVRA